jgi:hypothetical protein
MVSWLVGAGIHDGIAGTVISVGRWVKVTVGNQVKTGVDQYETGTETTFELGTVTALTQAAVGKTERTDDSTMMTDESP